MQQQDFRYEVASLEATGTYTIDKTMGNNFSFFPFINFNPYEVTEEGKKLLEEYPKYVDDLTRVIQDFNTFIKDCKDDRTTSTWNNFYTEFLDIEEIVKKEYQEELLNISMPCHYNYVLFLKNHFNTMLPNHPILPNFIIDLDNPFNQNDNVFKIQPFPIVKENNILKLGYKLFLFLSNKYHNQHMYLTLNINMEKF